MKVQRIHALGLALLLLGSLGAAALSSEMAPAGNPQVTVVLEITEREFEIFGVPFTAWTFNKTVPGPIIRIPLGTDLTIVLRNLHSEPHSFHSHFQNYDISNDGTSHTLPLSTTPHQADDPFGGLGITDALGLEGGLGLNPIGRLQPRYDHDIAGPGQEYTYKLHAGEVGTFVYHCHVFPVSEHVGRGLMGMIIVYPPGWSWEPIHHRNAFETGSTDAWVTDPSGKRWYEDVSILSELDLSTVTDKALVETTERVGKAQLVNFHTWASPYYLGPVPDGTPMRVIIANLGNEVHSWHIHGHNFDVLDKFDPQKRVVRRADALLIGPGESYETTLVATNPGFWFVHDHSITAAYQGMIGWLQVT